VARHEVTFKAYIDTVFEQLDEAERHLPREVAEGLVY
jgi:hypothetical protein